MADIDTETGEILQVYYRHSPELDQLFDALSKAQATFESAEKAGENPHFRSKYATLATVLEATKKGRSENGLALIQMPANYNNAVAVITMLGHKSGQWIESMMAVVPARYDAQGAGSVVTYLRRYVAMAMLGIAPEDDDGEAAVRPAATVGAGPQAAPASTSSPRGSAGSSSRPAPAPQAPPKKITPDEAMALAALLEENSADVAKVLEECRVDKLNDLTYAQRDRIMGILKKPQPTPAPAASARRQPFKLGE